MQIGGRTADVNIVERDGNKFKISIGEKIYDVDVVMADNGLCSILHNGVSYNMEVARQQDKPKTYHVNRGFSSFSVDVIDAQEKYLRTRRKDEGKQDDIICAPMPGKVVKINVAPGDSATDGDTLIVFEAMKMQSNLKVIGDCVVREVLVAEGDSVATGQALVKLDVIENSNDNEQ